MEKRHRFFIILLIYLFLLSIYLEIPVFIGGTMIPGITMLALMPLVLIYTYKQYKSEDFRFCLVMLGIAMLSILIARGLYGFENMFFKLAQFPVAIFMGISLFRLSSQIPTTDLRKIYFNLTILLVVGTILEYSGVLSGISLEVSKYLYAGSKYSSIDNIERDLMLIGWVRPRLFTSEASLLAIGFFVFSSAYLALTNTIRAFVVMVVLTLLFIVVSGSPIAIIGLLNLLVMQYLRSDGRYRRYLLLGGGIVVALVLSLPVIQSTYDKYYQRISTETIAEGTSLYARLYFPYLKGIPRAMSYDPLFGVGYGGKALMLKLSGSNLAQEAVVSMDFIDGANAFARIIMYLGIVGAALVVFAMLRYFRSQTKKLNLTFLIFWILYCQTLGTFETPRFWGYTFVIFSVLVSAKFTSKNKNSKRNQSLRPQITGRLTH